MKIYIDARENKVYSEEAANKLAEEWVMNDKYSLYDYIIYSYDWEEIFDGFSKEFMEKVIEDRKKEFFDNNEFEIKEL
nr:MAG TPA: hypothetical protein [Caudoviricetes sp.]